MSQENVVRGVRYPISLPSEGAAQRRTLDERCFVRFPALARLLAGTWMRLPLRSRLRRLVLIRLAGRAFAAANRRDFDVQLLSIDPGVEYHPAGDLLPPGMGAAVYGHDGYVRRLREWVETFDDFRFEPEEVIDLGGTLLVTVRWSGHGSGSGVPMSGRLFQLLTQKRSGLVQKQEDFTDRDDAVEAAGLSE
jgi:ketosteroid isomerase-like protein